MHDLSTRRQKYASNQKSPKQHLHRRSRTNKVPRFCAKPPTPPRKPSNGIPAPAHARLAGPRLPLVPQRFQRTTTASWPEPPDPRSTLPGPRRTSAISTWTANTTSARTPRAPCPPARPSAGPTRRTSGRWASCAPRTRRTCMPCAAGSSSARWMVRSKRRWRSGRRQGSILRMRGLLRRRWFLDLAERLRGRRRRRYGRIRRRRFLGGRLGLLLRCLLVSVRGRLSRLLLVRLVRRAGAGRPLLSFSRHNLGLGVLGLLSHRRRVYLPHTLSRRSTAVVRSLGQAVLCLRHRPRPAIPA